MIGELGLEHEELKPGEDGRNLKESLQKDRRNVTSATRQQILNLTELGTAVFRGKWSTSVSEVMPVNMELSA